jgi:hypothetical protein
MRLFFTIIICLWASLAWTESVVLTTPNATAQVTTKIPRVVHLDIERIEAETTFVITWRDEDCIWPQKGILVLGPDKFDRWSGHTFYRPWSYYRVCECCNETIIKRATAVKVEADNVTTKWLEVLQ